MKLALTCGLLGISCALLVGCHSSSVRPHSYCHKLATGINSYNHGGSNNRINAAQKAQMAQQYQALDCDDQ